MAQWQSLLNVLSIYPDNMQYQKQFQQIALATSLILPVYLPPNRLDFQVFHGILLPSSQPEVGPPVEPSFAMDGQDQAADQAINSYHRHSLGLLGESKSPPSSKGKTGGLRGKSSN
jgi:hypothetical protein